MSAAHTAGPWKVTPCSHGGGLLTRGDGSNKHPQSSLQIVPLEDARLIAAAPDLLTALEAIIAHWDAGNFSREPALWNPACAAITKARGQS